MPLKPSNSINLEQLALKGLTNAAKYCTAALQSAEFALLTAINDFTVVFTARRKAALQPLFMLRHIRLPASVCPSARHTPVLCQNDGSQKDAVFTVG